MHKRQWGSRQPIVVMAVLGLTMPAYALLPAGEVREVANPVTGLLCMSVALWGLLRSRRPRPSGWLLVLLGFLGWALGDLTFMIEQTVLGISAYPAPSDAVYVVSYGVLGAGLVAIVRRRGSRGDLPALLDAAILAVGTAVVAGVFVISPIAGDSSLTLLGKLTAAVYPVADVLLIGILARLWATPGARTMAFRLLAAALALTLFADALYNFTALTTGSVDSLLVNDLLWMASYVAIAGAAWSPSMHALAEPPPGREELSDPTKRMVVLTLGLLLPALTLLGDDLDGGSISGVLISLGSVVLSVLVLGRMAGLLSVVRAQAVQLAALARSDGLTGVANRRTLDHELSRACQAARTGNTALTVAIIDLDRFKQYNDTYGHQAGDLLLREATAAWVDILNPDETLARYGGEEFVVLFPGQTATQARARVLALLRATPHGQTFSAGIATWDPDTDPSTVLSGADIAMYNAKSAGRNRVCLAIEDESHVHPVRPEIFLQPIVDIATGEQVAVEALSRFPDADTAAVFETARMDGTWVELEAAAITAALAARPPGQPIAINVSLDGLGTDAVRDALDGRLNDVILEITEQTDVQATPWLTDEIQSLRNRGATIAVDDWGQGFSNLDRLLLLRPQIVKVEMSLVQNLHLDYHRALIQTVCGWADLVGAQICAEGVETEEQLAQLREIGVHLGQGWLFGAPSAPGSGRHLAPAAADA